MIKVLLVFPNLMNQMQLPTNLPLLAGCLKEKGYDVKLFDTTLYKTSEKDLNEMRIERTQVRKMNFKAETNVNNRDVFDDFCKFVKDYNPNLIAITVVDSTIQLALQLINKLGDRTIPTIFGGKHAIFNPEELIKNKEVDMLCNGEGEVTLVELCDRLNKNISYYDIDGLWIKKKDNVIIKNNLAKPVDLNTLPFEDFSIFDKSRLYSPMRGKMVSMIPINFDRGCPYQCTYCGSPTLFKMYKDNGFNYYRTKTVDRIYKELKYQIDKYNVEYLYFNSETFLAMPIKKFKEFGEMYKEFNLPFWCQTRVETVTDEKIKLLKSMNCDRVAIGIDHGSEEFRRTHLKKYFTNEQAIKAFDILNKYDMRIGVNNILGFPDETRELVFETINLSRKLKFDSINGFVFQPYTGAPLRKTCIERGYIKQGSLIDINSSIMGRSSLIMPQLSPWEIEGLLRTFVLYVCLPKKYYPQIRIAEQLDDEGDKMLEKLQKIYSELRFV
jgi:radical SAM superfamily enzyme YgiQ (UPF0313 family)